MTPVVLVIFVLNVVVFGMWLVFGQSPYMTENFLVSYDALAQGRWWTLITSEFSHVLFLHFFLNMSVLTTFGTVVEAIIGSTRFLVFYLIAAAVASAGHAGVSAFLLAKPELPALGASGALSGVIILFSLMIPQARLLLLWIIPMPAIVGAAVLVGLDLIGLFAQVEGGGLPIGHGAHLSGAAAGAVAYVLGLGAIGRAVLGRVDYGDVATWRRLMAQARE